MVFLASLMLTIYDCVQNAVREVGCRRLTISLRSISECASEYLVRGSFEGMPTNRSNAGCIFSIYQYHTPYIGHQMACCASTRQSLHLYQLDGQMSPQFVLLQTDAPLP